MDKDPGAARVGLIDEVLFAPRLLRLDILGGGANGLEELIPSIQPHLHSLQYSVIRGMIPTATSL